MKIAIGFITYNSSSSKYLPDFLESLFKSLENMSRSSYLILARDNSEERLNDNQVYIEEKINKEEKLINFSWSGANIGFSKAYNIMISDAARWGADYFLMINPDVFIRQDAIEKMVSEISRNGELGSLSPKILRWDFDNKAFTDRIDSCGLTVNNSLTFTDIGQGERDSGRFDRARILGPSGAAGLFRMSALEKVKEGGTYLDEDMFMYKEDCDLSYRLFLAGYKSVLVSDAILYHDRSVSAQGGGWSNLLMNRSSKSQAVRSWSFMNQHLLYIKYYNKQSLMGKLHIIIRAGLMFFYALLRERFLLKNYLIIGKKIFKAQKS